MPISIIFVRVACDKVEERDCSTSAATERGKGTRLCDVDVDVDDIEKVFIPAAAVDEGGGCVMLLADSP